MPSTFEAANYSFGRLLGRNETRSIFLPVYQRGFSWDKDRIEAFLNDFFEFEKVYKQKSIASKYFLGPLVLQEKSNEISLLDGQQRITTATIMFCALRNLAKEFSKENQLARDIHRDFILKNERNSQYSLVLGEVDKIFFLNNIQDFEATIGTSKIRSHKLLKDAYEKILERIKQELPKKTGGRWEKRLEDIRDCLANGVIVIGIKISDFADSFAIFESLNDRGMRLSAPDLLLNLLMQKCSNKGEHNRVRGTWDNMLRTLGPIDVQRFLRHFWVSQHGDEKASSLYRKIKKSLQTKGLDSVKYSRHLELGAEAYTRILDFDHDAEFDENTKIYLAGILNAFKYFNSMPLLMSALNKYGISDFSKIVKAVAVFSVRFKLAGNIDTKYLENAFYLEAKSINDGQKAQFVCTKLREKMPTNQQVLSSVQENDFDSNASKWILRYLSGIEKGKKIETTAKGNVNLEHIFPQNPKSGTWSNRSVLEPFLWRLGNLTLLGPRKNQKAANSSFEEKVVIYNDSKIELTKEIGGKYLTWDETSINQRSVYLAQLALKTFI